MLSARMRDVYRCSAQVAFPLHCLLCEQLITYYWYSMTACLMIVEHVFLLYSLLHTQRGRSRAGSFNTDLANLRARVAPGSCMTPGH